MVKDIPTAAELRIECEALAAKVEVWADLRAERRSPADARGTVARGTHQRDVNAQRILINSLALRDACLALLDDVRREAAVQRLIGKRERPALRVIQGGGGR
jgi:hypothetical protein